MDLKKAKSSVTIWLKKYRYLFLLLILGIALLCLPSNGGSSSQQNETTQPTAERVDMATQMEVLLSSISGAGKVKVLLAESTGEQYIYLSDRDSTTNQNGTTVRTDTVIITDANRNQQALLTQIIPPSYCGAVVLCQGGDQAAVRLAVAEAVSKLTGLGLDKICVLKMN